MPLMGWPFSDRESVGAFEGQVLIIEGGYEAFEAEILTAPELGESPSADAIREYELRSALHAYFTGASLKKAPTVRPKIQLKRAGKKEGGC